MAQAAWRGMTPATLARRMEAARQELSDTREMADRLGSETMNEMKANIATRGTARSGKVGRIDTGTMINAVDYRVTGSDLKWGLRVGWIHGLIKYFKFQEHGFTHTNGSAIEPMFAMRDAWTTAQEKARHEVHEVMQRVKRKIQ